jgi:thioredoxin 1
MPGAPNAFIGLHTPGPTPDVPSTTQTAKGAKPTMAEGISVLTDATFDEEISSSDEPVVVDFWAEWCGPCKMIAPILEEIAVEHAGKVRVAKLDVDSNPGVTRRFDVMSIPTVIVFQDGEPAKRMIGAKGKGQLLQELSEFL